MLLKLQVEDDSLKITSFHQEFICVFPNFLIKEEKSVSDC